MRLIERSGYFLFPVASTALSVSVLWLLSKPGDMLVSFVYNESGRWIERTYKVHPSSGTSPNLKMLTNCDFLPNKPW